MPTFWSIKTDGTEAKNFTELATRRQTKACPEYFFNGGRWSEGWVSFTNEKCKPSYVFKVYVCGDKLIVDATYAPVVRGWLVEWKIQVIGTPEIWTVLTWEDVPSSIEQLRKEVPEADLREALEDSVAEEVNVRLERFNKAHQD